MTVRRIIWARYGVREHGQWNDVKEFLPLISPHRIGPDVFPEVPGTQGKRRALWLLTETENGQRQEAVISDGEVFPPSTWPENWEEILYAKRKPRVLGAGVDSDNNVSSNRESASTSTLKIHAATYGTGHGDVKDSGIDVTERLRSLVDNGALDIVVSNSTLTPSQNPYRGKRKYLTIIYSIDGGEPVTRTVAEKDWLIIGPTMREQSSNDEEMLVRHEIDAVINSVSSPPARLEQVAVTDSPPPTAAALNDYLIRRFQISSHRLRGPMPIELRDFNRDDLARLFAELGFKRGAEIGVAEGHYSEVLLKANPDLELILVDPWHHYSDNPQGKSKEKHAFAFNEMMRRTEGFEGRRVHARYSMDAVRDVEQESLDFCYIDGHHSYPYVMCDIIEWTKRVRSGGIVAGDDVYKLDEKRWGAGPMEAIFDYARAMRISPWWLIGAPRSVDFFFVRP